jgi:hypothetical protein
MKKEDGGTVLEWEGASLLIAVFNTMRTLES